MNQREIRRLATLRAALMIDSCLNYGWESADLIEEIGMENPEKVKEQVESIRTELLMRVYGNKRSARNADPEYRPVRRRA